MTLNKLQIIAADTTMSSREIAELTGSSHDNVLKTIRRLSEEGSVFKTTPRETPYTNPQNHQTYTEFRLNFRDTMLIISGYNPQVRARIIDRWQELEKSKSAAIPQTLPEALRLAADLAEQKAKAEEALALAAPKAEALDLIAVASGSFCLRDAAKTLQIREKDFYGWLESRKWIYKRKNTSTWVAYAEKMIDGLLEHKVTTGDRGDGTCWAKTQVRVTPKGICQLAVEFGV